MIGKRNGTVLAEFRHIVKRWGWVLDVGNIKWLEPSQSLARRVERPGIVCVQAQSGIWADGGAHFFHHLDFGIQIQHTDFALENRRVMLLAHPRAVTSHLQWCRRAWVGRVR